MALKIGLNVAYSQIAIFASELKNPFNNWTEKHVAQGFAWRPGSVSFRTLVEDGPHSIEIVASDFLEALNPDAIRAIEVPFDIPMNGEIEIGSISDTRSLTLPPGMCLLRCAFLQPSATGDQCVRLDFAKKEPIRFSVVIADESLFVDGELLKDAQAA